MATERYAGVLRRISLKIRLACDDESNGIITIPETITYNTRKYVVTQIKTEVPFICRALSRK